MILRGESHRWWELGLPSFSNPHTALACKGPLQVQSDQKQITIEGLEAKIEDLQREKDQLQIQLESVETKNAAAIGEYAKEVQLRSKNL